MGCDIHAVVERKVDGEWVGVHNFPYFSGVHFAMRDRNYERFGMMAGVRREGPDSRGMPHDASKLARMEVEHWDVDGHSHSWNTPAELVPILLETGGDTERERIAALLLEGGDKAAEHICAYWLGVWGVDPADVRVVYWFDN